MAKDKKIGLDESTKGAMAVADHILRKNKLLADADELEDIIGRRQELEDQLKTIKEYEDQLRESIVKDLLKKGLQYCKTTSGLGFGMVKGKVSYKVKDGKEQEAIQWAIQEFPGLLSISASKLGKVVQPMMSPPEFIERKQSEPHLSVRVTESE